MHPFPSARRGFVLIGFFLGLGVSLLAAAAPDPDVQAGWDAFGKLENDKARAAFEKALKRGVAAAYAGLGAMHFEGAGVPMNEVEARRLFELGAAKKDPESILRLSNLLGRGMGGDQDMERARKLLSDLIIATRDTDQETFEEAERALRSLEESYAADALAEEEPAPDESDDPEWTKHVMEDRRPGAAEYREGREAFAAGEFERALKAFKRAGELDYTRAFAELGALYGNGHGVAMDGGEARRLFAVGASWGDGRALALLGRAWFTGLGGPQNSAYAKNYLERAVSVPAWALHRNDREHAQEILASLGEVTAAKFEGLNETPRTFAAKALEEYNAGDRHFKNKDYEKAYRAWQRAVALGHGPAFAELGLLHELGSGVMEDRKKARKLYIDGAAKGDPNAMLRLALAWRDSIGGPADVRIAKYWYERLVNHPTAAFNLKQNARDAIARMASVAVTVPPGEAPLPVPAAPVVVASTPAPVAAPAPQPKAAPVQAAMAGQAEFDRGTTAYQAKKVKEAVAWWEKAAAQGHVQAMVELGYTLEDGEGDVAADPEASFHWFQIAAGKNNLDALLGAGRAYLEGRGTQADIAKAREYFEKARTLGAGNPKAVQMAEAELAVLKGETPEDALTVGFAHYQQGKFDEAMKWFRKASDGRNFSASYNIGLLHERGEGVPRDPAQALVWYEKAKAQGHTGADTAIKRVKPKLLGLDDLKKAEAAHQAKKYAEARAAYEKAAAAGNVDAMRELAEIYRRGIAVIQNKRTAVSWYKKAAAAGDDFAAAEADSLQQEIQMWDQNLRMVQMAGVIDGMASAAADGKSGPTVPFDSLIKNSPWTVEQLVAAVKSRADAEALAVAIRTDGVVDLYDGDYRRMKAIKDGTPFAEYGNLNMAFIENMKPGAGKWVKDLVDAAIAKRRAEMPPALMPVDSAELRARAKAGDAEALCVLNLLPQADLKLGAVPLELRRSVNDLRELVRKANHRPGFSLLGDELEYNTDKEKVNRAQAAEYFRMAAEAGSAQGADKLASAFNMGSDGGVATNWSEVEYWLIEAAARARPGQFTVMPPEHKLYLLYSSAKPVGSGLELLAVPEDLRWLRELVRRGGAVGEYAALTLDNMRRKPNQNIDAILKDLPPEVPPFAAAEVARLEASAKAGNIEAMLKLADALATGRGLRQHDRRAFDYYLQAANHGSVPAMKRVAGIYATGFGVKKDPAQRLAWLEKAAAAGGTLEAFELARQLNGRDSKATRDRMVMLFEKAIAGGEKGAAEMLAAKYRYGFDGFERNPDKALEILLKETEKGNIKPAGTIGGIYKDKKDYANAVLWMRKARDAGEKTVTLELARSLALAERHEEANLMYKEAAESGVAEAQYMYASSLEQTSPAEAYAWHKKLVANPGASGLKTYGERFIREYEEELNAPAGSDLAIRRQAKTGDTTAMLEYARRIFAKERDDAINWLRWAANKGDVNGMLALAEALFTIDKPQAMEWVNKAVAAGSPQAMLALANQLAATDMTKALEWLRKAEELGNADAKFQLGGMHYQGRGMAQDQAKGIELMLAAAEAGSLAAQFEMGRAQMQGMPGLPANQARGIELLKRAADANLPQAAAVLGEIYERGVGTAPNLREAAEYYRKAVTLGLTQFNTKAGQLESMIMKGMK